MENTHDSSCFLGIGFFKISWIFHSSLQSKYLTVISKDEPSTLWLKELGESHGFKDSCVLICGY